MLVRLANPAARLTLIVFALLLFAALSFFSVRAALAAHNAGLGTAAGYEKAVQLEPGNFEYWYLLGHYRQYSLEHFDLNRAVQSYRAALALNPRSSETWLDLATLYESEDGLPEAGSAFLEAKRAYPLSAEVAWRYGNFLLRQEKTSEAFAEIRRAAYLEPKRSGEAFSRCWRVNPDIRAILDNVIPPDRDAYLDILFELAQIPQLDPALVVWERLVSLKQKLRMTQVMPFTDALLRQQRWDDASRVWSEAVRLSTDPSAADPPGSALWDGGFETGVRGGGLAWIFAPPPRGVKTEVDTSEKHSGRSSLRLDFDGKHNVKFESVCHAAIVQPAARYLFSAWVHTRRLTTDEGIRFRLSWTEGMRNVATGTSDVRGSEPWTQVQVRWTSPPEIHRVNVCIVRQTSANVDGQIQGTAWVDDVSLIPQSSTPARP